MINPEGREMKCCNGLQCVIFDLDNTLVDSKLDFDLIKREIGTEMPILEYRASVGPAEQARVDAILDRHEKVAAATCTLLPGARELLEYIHSRPLRSALLTRNSRKTIDFLSRRLALHFDTTLSREEAAPKPSPEPIQVICQRLGIQPHKCLMVGDYLYDMQTAERAGAMTMLVHSPHRHKFDYDADFEVPNLHDALELVRRMTQPEERDDD